MNESENIEVWLEVAAAKGASDLHIIAGHKPTLRLHGQLVDLDAETLSTEFVHAGLTALCDPEKLEQFEAEKNIDFALQREFTRGRQRFRANYFVIGHENSIVTQREVGQDIQSFADGLKYGLRQDPDVILVGEIRDQETAQMALSAAETGHLVFSTLHTRDAKGAVSRFTDLFRPATQPEVRAQLAMALRAVVSQHLLPSARGDKRQLALEIMINNNAIASAIRLGKLESIDTGIVTGRADGMMTLDESLRRLMKSGAIHRVTAERYVSDSTILNR